MSALRATAAALALGLAVAGCGGGSSASSTSSTSSSTHTSTQRTTTATVAPPVTLHAARTLALPEARSGAAASKFGGALVVVGGLSSAGVSTSTVFEFDHRGTPVSAPALSSPVHDAAAAELGGHVLLFGGGESEGSNRIVVVLPGGPRLLGTLPQALSDLTATVIGSHAYIAGGWNGAATNPDIYAVAADGTVRIEGTLPQGVRYPATGTLAGKLIVAGGETTSGDPTTDVWSFDPATGAIGHLPALPVPTDHAAGASLNGRFYVIGGERRGVFTDAILSWAPGEHGWHDAGTLPAAVADLAAAPYQGGIAAIGGRGSAGKVATITVLK